MRSKQFLLVLISIFYFVQQSYGQTYGNEWINYNQTYFKFGVARDDVYRISIADLVNLGLPSSVTGDQLQMFRDGSEVPMYVSSSAVLTSSDYIEFYGEKANGTVDIPLYKDPSSQLNPNQNSISDSAYYFITFNSTPNHLRYNPRANTITSPPIKEAFFWDKTRINYRNSYTGGVSYFYPTSPVIYLTSSQYEDGEGYSKTITTNNDSVTFTCLFPYKVAGSPGAYFKSTVVGNSYITEHRMKIFANNNLIGDSTFAPFGYKRFFASVPMSYLTTANKMVFKYTPMNTVVTDNIYDRYGISSIEFRYPREFNFNNVDSFYFELDPKLTDYYLEISNFKTNGVAPRLYDISTNEYLVGDITVAGVTRFLIPASTTIKRLFLQSQATSSTIGSVSNLRAVQFKNYTQSSLHGNYIILSHNRLFDDGNGVNQVNEYKNYRATIAGGSFNPIVVDVNDLYEEFGYGYPYHPQGVKNFLHYAYSNAAWVDKPQFVFIIGKGIEYKDYLTYSKASSSTYPYPVVPSFGEPCSDVLLTDFDFSSKPKVPIGRLPVWYGSDIKVYLDKIKEHESWVENANNMISDSVLWQKNVLHIAGAKKEEEQAPIVSALIAQEKLIKDTLLGAEVTTIKKSTTSTVESANSAMIDKLFKDGLGLVQFFGHASSSTLDYNLDNPELMVNPRKYPMFIANGCGVGNVFILAVGDRSLGEKFVLSPKGGSITFIASDNTGLSNKLETYTDSLYRQIGQVSYGKSIGEQIRKGIQSLNLSVDPLLRQHAEQIILNGDPAASIHSFDKSDYAVEDKSLTFKQLNITTSIDTFDVSFVLYNLGKYNNDSISVFVKRTLPNGIENVLVNTYLINISVADTIHLRIPTLGDIGVGDNSLEVIIDQQGFIDEVSESNNTIKRVFSIFNDDLVPVYPYEFGIVNTPDVMLKGSTLNPFATLKTYVMQIDTTEEFNSPILQSTKISSTGGLVKWQVSLPLNDSTVYYWRTAMDTSSSNPKHKWTTSSFIRIDGSLSGWNQSHYYQFNKDNYADILLDSASRKFEFVGVNKKLLVQNVCMYSPPPYYYSWPEYRVKLNGSTLYTDGCDPYPGYSSLQIMVIDSLTGEPWKNAIVGTGGRFGSYAPCRTSADPFFEFSFTNSTWRKRIIDFIDSIPDGFYIMIQPRLCTGSTCGSINKFFIKDWKADTTIYGANNSLYHKIRNLGFTKVDSFYKNRPMIFFARKNMPSTAQQVVEADSTKILLQEFQFSTYLYEGKITSTKIGPSSKWGQFIRRGNTQDPGIGDSVLVDIYGIDQNETETLLAQVQGDTSLSFIDEKLYPYLKLVMNSRDNFFTTPEQVKYWRVLYQLVPEIALNPNAYFSYKDSVQQGQPSHFEVALENVTEYPIDSMLVKYDMIDKNKTRSTILTKRYFPIQKYDTIHVAMEMNSSQLPGNNVFIVEANPNNDQLEQYHPNNLGYLNYYVAPDKQNPLIDVTFDGVHIMDKDIVSSKPLINITLRDENKYLALNDTSLVGVYMRYPGDNPTSETYIPFDGVKLKFFPAVLADDKSKNVARIEFRPEFTVDGNDYILSVKAKDKSGNVSGNNAYKVGFEVVNKPAISSVVNYPNPFTTSTQFVFTITGSEIPTNFKIQILSQTGKVVKEILKSDLGPLHIGTNVTEYKWKGDDQYGQPLGNGVYLYRVISNLHGETMDHYQKSAQQNADKWIEKGFGKLYIMR